MSPRRYVMENRARTAEDTRRRIVEATYALHQERAIGDTTMKDIAERADVGLGTVYHHFPTYNDAVRACGAHTLTISAPPDVSIFRDETWSRRVAGSSRGGSKPSTAMSSLLV